MTSTLQHKKASKKSVSIEHTIYRVGVSWRPRSNGKNYVVEMRPPTWHWRLNFGYYATKAEAMIARDYGALLRVSAGEDGSSAGGFNFNDHPSICEFEESHVIFKSIETFESRCDEFRRLLALYPHQPKEKGADSPYKEFCNKARNDIAIAIAEFRKRNPQKFDNRRQATEVEKELQQVNESLDGRTHVTPLSSNFEAGSSYSSQSSMMPDNKEKLEQFVLGAHEHHKEHSPSGIATFNHSSPLDGKSGCVIRGFDCDSVFNNRSQETSPWWEKINYKTKEDSKSLLQVQIANFKSPQPYQEEFKVQDDGVSTVVYSSSLRSSYGSDNMQLESVGNQTFDQWMSTSATTCSNTLGSLSAGTSVEEETGLSSNNRNNLNHDLAQAIEQFVEGDGVHLQVANSSHIDMGAVARHDTTCFDQNEISDMENWLDDLLSADESLEDQTAMDSYEMYNWDINPPVQSNISVPSESNCAPSHTLSTTSNPISAVERTMSKVKATDERFKQFKGTTSSAKGYSMITAYAKAMLAAQLESERVNLDIVVPSESNCAPSHTLSTTSNPISVVERTMSKVKATDKRFKGTTSSAKGYSTLSAYKKAVLAAQLESERVNLDIVVQQNNKLKMENLRIAKEGGVISNEEYIQHVKALLNL